MVNITLEESVNNKWNVIMLQSQVDYSIEWGINNIIAWMTKGKFDTLFTALSWMKEWFPLT